MTHAVHVVKELDLPAMAEYDRPVGIGGLIRVDTTLPVDVRAWPKQSASTTAMINLR